MSRPSRLAASSTTPSTSVTQVWLPAGWWAPIAVGKDWVGLEQHDAVAGGVPIQVGHHWEAAEVSRPEPHQRSSPSRRSSGGSAGPLRRCCRVLDLDSTSGGNGTTEGEVCGAGR
jgi:hypothetical protein